MIKNIIDILEKMEAACPVECFSSMRPGRKGELILEWIWLQNNKKMMYSIALEYKDECARVDIIDYSIDKAKRSIKRELDA